MSRDVFAEIAAAAEGLLYPSESDEPVVPVRMTAAEVERLAKSKPVRETSALAFFEELEGLDEGWGRMRRVIEGCLSDVRVLRVGARRVEVYVVGKAGGAGEWVGVKTVSVET